MTGNEDLTLCCGAFTVMSGSSLDRLETRAVDQGIEQVNRDVDQRFSGITGFFMNAFTSFEGANAARPAGINAVKE